MKNNFRLSLIQLIITLLIFPLMGCQKSKNAGGTTTGNPLTLSIASSGQSKTIAFHSIWEFLVNKLLPRVQALPPPATLVDANNLTVSMTSAWIVVKDIEFKTTEVSESSEIDGSEISLTGPYLFDLFSIVPNKIENGITTKSGIKRIKMKLSKFENSITTANNYPAQLTGQSIYISGKINNNDFTFKTSEESEYEVGGPNEIATSSVKSDLLVSINIANLIRKIDLSQITNGTNLDESNRFPSTNPCPLIDTSAQDIYTCFLKGLKSEANVGKDDNGNGEIESTENPMR